MQREPAFSECIAIECFLLGIRAGILVAQHLKSTDELLDNRPSPRTEALVASAVQWAERIMRKIDSLCSA